MTGGLKGALTRRIHVCYSNTRGGTVEDAGGYLAPVPGIDLAPLVASKGDKRLMQKTRLDCDWHAENARCFAEMTHDGVEFLLAWIWGRRANWSWTKGHARLANSTGLSRPDYRNAS